MRKKLTSSGHSIVALLIILVVLAGLGLAGWFVWEKQHETKDNTGPAANTKTTKDSKQSVNEDATKGWATATSQDGNITMKVPDGWTMNAYPNGWLGAFEVNYNKGEKATVVNAQEDYAGHTLRFRLSLSSEEGTLEPQWGSPQPGLTETTSDYTIGSIKGKKFTGVFTGDLNQTVYQYKVNHNGKQLDVVYTVDQANGDTDNLAIVEKAIQTIKLNY